MSGEEEGLSGVTMQVEVEFACDERGKRALSGKETA